MKKQEVLLSPVLYILMAFIALGALGAALVGEYFYNLKPCILCWYQRYAYMAALAISVAGFIPFLACFHRYIITLLTLSYGTNAFFAIYQVLVEKKIITLPSLCTGIEIDTLNKSFEDFQKSLQKAADHVPCDQIPWEMFSISMAGYNAFFTLMMTLGLGTLTALAYLREK